jgi:hypothetical protein
MENKTKLPQKDDEKDREHKLKDAFNAMGYINLAIAK